jgi:hypothetical protein
MSAALFAEYKDVLQQATLFEGCRLKALAQSRGTPINRLLDEMTTLMLAEFDAETRFNVRAARGASRDERGLELLQKAR